MVQLLPSNPSASAFEKMLAELTNGRQIAIPTETVYGLAADATNGLAIAGIFERKGRPKFNPLICHVSDIAMAKKYGILNTLAVKLCEEFWPGPLTIVVPEVKNSDVHELVTAGLGTIGLRCPDGVSRQLIGKFGKPLAAPSANKSGGISPTKAAHVAEEYKGEDLLVLDGGPCIVGLESTIVAINNGTITMLRPGAITTEMISKITGVEVLSHDAGGKILAPGMMKSHYAPNAQVKINVDSPDADCGYLGFGPASPDNGKTINLSNKSNLAEAAANLYSALKSLDEMGVNTICVQPIPNEGLGIAINDRLMRAAAPRPKQ
ncbi:MAG: L-threonylcarbamoyladenylate synthase [Rhizobiaceae bacterium]